MESFKNKQKPFIPKENDLENFIKENTEKIDYEYTKRLLNFLMVAINLTKNNNSVEFIQKSKEKDLPFDASGWIIIAVNKLPLFHISPDDISKNDISDIVKVVDESNNDYAYTGTTKTEEFNLLRKWSSTKSN